MNQEQLSTEDILQLMSILADALDALHKCGIIHRDLKPSNITIRPDGSAVILDFGIAKSVDHQDQTQTGAVMGTPTYMAPEQLDAKHVSSAADRYALGLIFYQLLARRLPWPKGTSASRITVLKMTGKLQSLDSVLLHCPAGLSDLTMKMLSYKPMHRPDNCKDWVQDLKKINWVEKSPVENNKESQDDHDSSFATFSPIGMSMINEGKASNRTFPDIGHEESVFSDEKESSQQGEEEGKLVTIPPLKKKPETSKPKQPKIYTKWWWAIIILASMLFVGIFLFFLSNDRDVMVNVGSYSTMVDAQLGPVSGECSGGRCVFFNVTLKKHILSLMIEGCEKLQRKEIKVIRGEGVQQESIDISCANLRDVHISFSQRLSTRSKITIDGMKVKAKERQSVYLYQAAIESYFLKISTPGCPLIEYSFDVRQGEGVQEVTIPVSCTPG